MRSRAASTSSPSSTSPGSGRVEHERLELVEPDLAAAVRVDRAHERAQLRARELARAPHDAERAKRAVARRKVLREPRLEVADFALRVVVALRVALLAELLHALPAHRDELVAELHARVGGCLARDDARDDDRVELGLGERDAALGEREPARRVRERARRFRLGEVRHRVRDADADRGEELGELVGRDVAARVGVDRAEGLLELRAQLLARRGRHLPARKLVAGALEQPLAQLRRRRRERARHQLGGRAQRLRPEPGLPILVGVAAAGDVAHRVLGVGAVLDNLRQPPFARPRLEHLDARADRPPRRRRRRARPTGAAAAAAPGAPPPPARRRPSPPRRARARAPRRCVAGTSRSTLPSSSPSTKRTSYRTPPSRTATTSARRTPSADRGARPRPRGRRPSPSRPVGCAGGGARAARRGALRRGAAGAGASAGGSGAASASLSRIRIISRGRSAIFPCNSSSSSNSCACGVIAGSPAICLKCSGLALGSCCHRRTGRRKCRPDSLRPG